MASIWSSIFALVMIFMTNNSPSLALPTSTISASPALLPYPPLSSPTPTLSPDITPLFPSPGGVPLSPSESSLPTIPSSPSPPNPDATLAPGPDQLAISPSGFLPASSSVSPKKSSGFLNLVLFLSLLMFGLMQLSGM